MSKHADELTRKEMKAPDAFQSAAAKAAAWLTGKQKTIVAAVVGALVVVAIVLGAMGWWDSRKSTAGALLYRTLDDADGQISSVPLPGVSVPIFPDKEAQYRAVLGRAEELRKTYPSTEAAHTAALAAGAANLRLAAWDAAVADYESYLAKAPPKDSLSFLAVEGIGRAKEAKGDLAGRAGRLREAAGADPGPGRPRRAGARPAARKERKARRGPQAPPGLPQDFKESQLRPEADAQLAALGGTR